jgi:hypothetical protein
MSIREPMKVNTSKSTRRACKEGLKIVDDVWTLHLKGKCEFLQRWNANIVILLVPMHKEGKLNYFAGVWPRFVVQSDIDACLEKVLGEPHYSLMPRIVNLITGKLVRQQGNRKKVIIERGVHQRRCRIEDIERLQ